MALTPSFKPIGQSQAVVVTAGISSTVTIAAFTDGESVNFAAFVNTGTIAVAVQMGQTGKAPAAVFPTAGVPSNSFILPGSMTMPAIVATPRGPFDLNMIGAAAGPATVVVYPVGPQ